MSSFTDSVTLALAVSHAYRGSGLLRSGLLRSDLSGAGLLRRDLLRSGLFRSDLSGAGFLAGASRRRRGFTMIELLVVIAIMAIALAAVSLSMRTDTNQLEREAQRLAAQLDGAKAASRAMGIPVFWSVTEKGYQFNGLPKDELSQEQVWLNLGTTAQTNGKLVLGPEPVLPPQSIILKLGEQQIRVASNGVRPFAVVALDADLSAEAGNTP